MITKQLYIQDDNINGVWTIYIRELTWEESLQIDYNSYSPAIDGNEYSGENELKETVKLCVEGVEAPDGTIQRLEFQLKPEWIEPIYNFYMLNFTLSPAECATLYEQAKNYFKGAAQNQPIDPMIIRVQYMIDKVVSYTNTEFGKLSNKDLEKISLIISAKNDLSDKDDEIPQIDPAEQQEKFDVLGFQF